MRGSLGNRGDSGEQGRAGASRGQSSAARRIFFDGLGQWACQEAAGREKLGSNPNKDLKESLDSKQLQREASNKQTKQIC